MGVQNRTIHIVGAGLAGSECALQLAEMGHEVVLIEMRGSGITTPAHKSEDFAELVCSNSFGSLASSSAPGLLKKKSLPRTCSSRMARMARAVQLTACNSLIRDFTAVESAINLMLAWII